MSGPRYIDANGLKNTLDYYISEAGWTAAHNEALTWVKDEFIDAEPTANVVPVVHGHWGDEISVREYDDVNGGYFITCVVPCSNCGYEIAARNKTKFCPECGAKMESEGEE